MLINDTHLQWKKGSNVPRTHRILSEEEKVKLESLESNFLNSIINAEINTDVDLMALHGLTNLSIFNVKNFVKFIKMDDDFQTTALDTQTACLKAQILSCLVFLCVYLYDPTASSFITLGIPVHEDQVIQAFSSYGDCADHYTKLRRESQNELIKDPYILAILLMVLVFSPEGVNMLMHRHLSNIQDQYLIQLKHYFEC